MSDSEECDFSASEDEWLPENVHGKNDAKTAKSTTSARDELYDSTDDDASGDEEVPRKRAKTRASKARIPLSRIKLKVSASDRRKQYAKIQSDEIKSNLKDSDSSGDEHLVNPNQLDLNSDFFNEAPVEQHSENVPEFDCNVGVRLSDSSEKDDSDAMDTCEQQCDGDVTRPTGKDLIAKINRSSRTFVNFEGVNQFNKNIQQAKIQFNSMKSKESKRDTAVDIGDLLAMGEHQKGETSVGPTAKNMKDESDSDWEEVEEKEEPGAQQDVQITLDANPVAIHEKKRCKTFDIEACVKRIVNREKRENQLVLHKVNIVMGIAHGNYVNAVLNSSKLLALALTLIPSQKCYPKDRTNLQYIEQITKFFKEIVDLKERRMYCRFKKLPALETSLRLQMLTKAAICKRDYILLFIILLRAIGIQCRMVMSLAVVPKKVPQSEMHQSQTKSNDKPQEHQSLPKASTSSTSALGLKAKSGKVDRNKDREDIKQKSNSGKSVNSSAKIPQLDGNDDLPGGPSKQPRLDPVQKKPAIRKDKKNNPEFKNSSANLQEINMFSPRKTRKQRQEQLNSNSNNEFPKSKPKKPIDNLSDTNPPTSSPTSSSSILVRKDYKVQPKNITNKKHDKLAKEIKTVSEVSPSSSSTVKGNKRSTNLVPPKAMKLPSEEHKTPDSVKPKNKSKTSPKILKVEIFDKKLKRRLDRRVLSTDDEFRTVADDKTKVKSGVNLWIEVFAEDEEQWITIDAVGGKVHCLEHIIKLASSPLVYVLAWNNDGSIKDVSPRYCPNYATSTKKLRIDKDWLDETLAKFRGKQTARDIEEDRALNRALMEQPLPKTISEYKNHPLYALKRHLLKFEGIYPPDAPTLGFIKEEPVYARECVQMLHSREIWLKQARTVKMFETPYKVVNARPKYDRAAGQMLPAQPLELYGYWQTQDYEPPTAEDGIVPRNAYGNVELFKPCMLPKKTVHLQLPSLNRICKKLGIDCAQAVTGFDFHGGSSHPVYDGFVICEEFKDIIVDAWYQEQEQEEKREREKYEKRVYGNWKKLIRGLLIRRKLQNKYNFDNLSG
ncbi:DNA repair protein complementing XP-C cells homolog [Armigeres subalbatus]|uniref:DNA repair protein complementing XP-C cells homolog n=1 Tax=Armigeres subalbatus TaxID=124917 RepID=UPI002ED06CF1